MKTGPNKRLAVLRESIGKTVRMFVEQGITVTQRGTQPFVMWNPHTCKAQRINMPMIPENAELELLEALQGFLDHECAHVFFTPPEKQMAVANAGKRAMLPMMNMIEDIRIEKLLPRKFPGTAANLSRMRSGAFGTILKNICQKALAMPQPQQAMSMMVPAFRALAGQPEMQQLMDEGGFWPSVQPLIDKLPNLAHRLQTMETYDEVIEISQWIFDTLGSPRMAPSPFDEPPADGEPSDDSETTPSEVYVESEESSDSEGEEPSDGEEPSEAGDDEGEGDEPSGDSDSDGGDDEEGDEGDADSGEGEGSPEGSDGDGEDDDEGDGSDGSGDADADEKSDDDASDDGDDEGNSSEGDDAEGGDADADDADPGEPADGKTGDGKSKHSVTEAMKKLNSTQRQVLFMYNKKRLDVAAIAEKMKISEENVRATLQIARRNLRRLMLENKS